MYMGISVLFVLLLFRHFGIVLLCLVSLVGKLLGCAWECDVAGPCLGGADGSFFVGE